MEELLPEQSPRNEPKPPKHYMDMQTALPIFEVR